MRSRLFPAIALSLTTILTSCATKPDEPHSPEPYCTCCDGGREPINLPPKSDDSPKLDSASVYFDYDSFLIKEEFALLLKTQGKYLNYVRQSSIQVVGNADERGSSEYNLALGQKRAEAVKKALLAQGVWEKQIEAISFGKEKPLAPGHDEAAWAKNRRVDFVSVDAAKK